MRKKINIENDPLIRTEWLVTNGLGGYSSGTALGIPTRKYHALLVSALESLGRTAMLNYVSDSILVQNEEMYLSAILQTKEGEENKDLYVPLVDFKVENGFPIWRYEFNGLVLQKTLFMVHGQNTLHMVYRLLTSPNPVTLKWRPFIHFRKNDEALSISREEYYPIKSEGTNYEIGSTDFPVLRIYPDCQHSFSPEPHVLKDVFYPVECERGYDCVETLTSPGFFSFTLCSNEEIRIVASTEPWQITQSLQPKEAYIIENTRKRRLIKLLGPAQCSTFARRLALAADQFIFTPASRFSDVIRIRAYGAEAKSIIAGYPWFTDWGRDTMISLEGLTLATGRHHEAYAILCTYAYHVKEGLVPNMFPEGSFEGVYYTADATLWFFHAANRYVKNTQDLELLELLLPTFREIIRRHIEGTMYGIKVDQDGLLKQGHKNHPLTWMDAKVGDWIVTPRRGKAVEINALWYNALKIFEEWTGETLEITERCYKSFNDRFWNSEALYLYDIVDGDEGNDLSLRPNQLFSFSLDHPILQEQYWPAVLEAVTQELLTPFGLRTLSPTHKDYKNKYDGDLRARDAAYHQGTVWPWLMGAYIDAWLKVHPKDLETAAKFLKPIENHIDSHCLGSISEIFDAEEPFTARGCFAQAWSIAEVLRCLIKVNPELQKKFFIN